MVGDPKWWIPHICADSPDDDILPPQSFPIPSKPAVSRCVPGHATKRSSHDIVVPCSEMEHKDSVDGSNAKHLEDGVPSGDTGVPYHKVDHREGDDRAEEAKGRYSDSYNSKYCKSDVREEAL